jgi:hypothetical protein
MEPAPPRSLRPNQRRADSGSLSVTQGDTQTLTLLCMRAPFTPARSSAAAATSTGPARSVTVRDAQPPGPNDVEPAGRRPCRRVRRLVVAEQRSQLQPPDVVLSLLRVSWVQKCAPSSHSRGTTSPLPHHPVRHLLDPRALGSDSGRSREMQKPKAPSKADCPACMLSAGDSSTTEFRVSAAALSARVGPTLTNGRRGQVDKLRAAAAGCGRAWAIVATSSRRACTRSNGARASTLTNHQQWFTYPTDPSPSNPIHTPQHTATPATLDPAVGLAAL